MRARIAFAVLAATLAAGACRSEPAPTAQRTAPPGAEATTPTSPGVAAARDRMVEESIAGRGVADPRVLRALRRVPRHAMVPAALRDRAYEDRPLPIGHGQTISQPYIVAAMTEAAQLSPGERVLEVGTGSGYQAAVLAELGDVEVYSIEIVEPLAKAHPRPAPPPRLRSPPPPDRRRVPRAGPRPRRSMRSS